MDREASQTGVRPFLIGGVSGLVATGPMSLVMVLGHRFLPISEQYPLPPKEIVQDLTEKTGTRGEMSRRQINWLTVLAHFGYGAAAGSVYGAVARKIPGNPLLKGIIFGILLWGASYLGWLPALGILKPATEHPAQRNMLMIAAHLVWGAVVGWVNDRFE